MSRCLNNSVGLEADPYLHRAWDQSWESSTCDVDLGLNESYLLSNQKTTTDNSEEHSVHYHRGCRIIQDVAVNLAPTNKVCCVHVESCLKLILFKNLPAPSSETRDNTET